MYRHLELATDPEAMLAFFRRHASRMATFGVLREVRIPRVFPRGNGRFVIQYELFTHHEESAAGRKWIAGGELVPPGSSQPAYSTGHAASVLWDSELGLCVPLFPFDPELPALEEWARADRVQGRLREVLGTVGNPSRDMEHCEVTGLSVLAYRLGRRCTVRYDLGPAGGTDCAPLIGRISRRDSLADHVPPPPLRPGPSMPNSSPELKWAEALVRRADLGIQLFAVAPGRSLHDLLGDLTFENACESAGRLLACIHRASKEGRKERSSAQDSSRLLEQVKQVCTIFPDCLPAFMEAEHSVRALPPIQRGTHTLIHGDFYDKQVLYSGERVTVVDFDMLAVGDPALDVGNFNAHLSLRKMQHPESATSLDRGRRAFENAYDRPAEEFVERCRVHESTTLIRLAALYSLRPRWRHLILPLLEESKRCLVLN